MLWHLPTGTKIFWVLHTKKKTKYSNHLKGYCGNKKIFLHSFVANFHGKVNFHQEIIAIAGFCHNYQTRILKAKSFSYICTSCRWNSNGAKYHLWKCKLVRKSLNKINFPFLYRKMSLFEHVLKRISWKIAQKFSHMNPACQVSNKLSPIWGGVCWSLEHIHNKLE